MSSILQYRITRCCNASETQIFNITGGHTQPASVNTFQFVGTTTTIGGIDFIFDECYVIERLGNGPPLQNVVDTSNFSLATDCQDLKCTPCIDPDLPLPNFMKLVFTPCCDNFATVEFKGIDWQDYTGVYIPLVNPQSLTMPGIVYGQCYVIQAEITTMAEYAALPQAAPMLVGTTYQLVTLDTTGTPCEDPDLACPPCPQNCFRVVDCDGTQDFLVVSNPSLYGAQDISNFVGQFVTLVENAGVTLPETYFVVGQTNGPCTNGLLNISVDPLLPPPM